MIPDDQTNPSRSLAAAAESPSPAGAASTLATPAGGGSDAVGFTPDADAREEPEVSPARDPSPFAATQRAVAGAGDVRPGPEEPSSVPGLVEWLERVDGRLGAFEGTLAELGSLEQRHLGVIERLHADNTKLREGEIVQAIKPLLLDLARLHDDVAQMIARGGEAFAKVGIVCELILDVLGRHGVTELRPEVGQPFDPRRHQAIGVVATDDPALDGAVAGVTRVGFVRDLEYLVRPAQVDVHRHIAGAPGGNQPVTNGERD